MTTHRNFYQDRHMAKYKPQHSRLLFIDRKIREGRFPNCSRLADEWEVSRKTIQRDIDYLRYQLDAPIAYSAKERGYFYTEDQYTLPAMNIRESDLFGVYLADKLLVQYEGTPIYDSLCSVFEKIEQSLPEKVSLDSRDQEKFTVFPPFATTIDPAVWETVINGLRSSRQVAIDYRTPGKPVQHRVLDPYHAVRFEGDWYIVGHCHLRREVRTFSMSRMVSAYRTGETFTVPEDFDFQKLSGSRFGVHWGDKEIEVRILFSSRVADYVRERQWHPSQELTQQDNGDVLLSLTVNHLLELKRWVLSWGAEARVLAPQSFAEDVRKTLEKALAGYGGEVTFPPGTDA
jgi:predicted DNA-binding transcriptional regulator YafY